MSGCGRVRPWGGGGFLPRADPNRARSKLPSILSPTSDVADAEPPPSGGPLSRLRCAPPPVLPERPPAPSYQLGIRRTTRRSVICASLFGVGAPEALVIGVVALLVFGPKGLAEVARNFGKTLRAFQPTIRELQDVSREFRSTLEREIGIDEVPPSTNYKPTTYSQPPAADPNMKPETTPYTSEELMKVTEEQLAASAAAAWNSQPAAPSQQQESEATFTSQSNDAAPSEGNDGSAATAVTKPDSSQANQPEKVDMRDKAA
ncbi:hypothetical protein PR202_gb15844 [Eleusine coracana subsp. coracana]|uniref:Uncharacterized protein n=1 Tax=Eleusine coracana subsp. coracana TaxID=191504 RepID=A0AAV5EWN0_ELECO|nr:hypothetical protein PR202_gb15844 [Eleusine coracana subsp. coracana]